MRTWTLAFIVVVALTVPAGPADAAGQLDAAFGSGGIASTGIPDPDRAWAVAVQPDQKIVLAGFINTNDGDKFAVVRLLANGSMDQTFDTDGLATISFDSDPNTTEVARSVAVQSDGKIVVAGYVGTVPTAPSPTSDFAIARFTTTGGPDTTFSTDGKDTIDFGGFDRAHGVALQSDGKIVVAGFTGSGNFALARYETTGILDAGGDAFDTDGKLTTDLGDNDRANAVAIQSDGKIVAIGNSGSVWALARYNTDGTLDAAFDGPGGTGNGRFTDDASFGGGQAANALAIQPDGKIVVAGPSGAISGTAPTANNILIVRYNSDGTLDTPFGPFDLGRNRFDLGQSEEPSGIALASDGKIVLTGWMGSLTGAGTSTAGSWVTRFTSDGDLDTTFDSDGIVIFSDIEASRGVVIQSDGKIVFAGHDVNATITDMTAVRLLVSPDLQLSALDAKAKEGKVMSFRLSLDRIADTNVTVSYTTVAGSAKAGKDFVTVSGSVGIPSGSQSVIVPVSTVNNRRAERNEKFTLVISGAVGATIVDDTAVGKIVDND